MKNYILHIETSTKTCSVSLGKDGKLVDLIEETPENFTHAEVLAVFIQNILKKNNLSTDHLKAVAVSKGPGSYTGLRIGVSTAKGLCYSLKIPLIAIDSLTILANHFQQLHPEEKFGALKPMIDARRKEVYTASYSNNLEMIAEINNEVIDIENYQSSENEIWFGDGANKFSDIKNPMIKIIEGFDTSSEGMVDIAQKMFEKSVFEDVAYFEPFYLKDFVTGKK